MKYWIVVFLMLASGGAEAGWLDRDHTIFFPESSRANISAYQTFSIFWWDFLVVTPSGPQGGEAGEKLDALCAELKKQPSIQRAECNPNLSELGSFVADWSSDLPLRARRPEDAAIHSRLGSALAQASLPSGGSGLIPILRADPLESWRALKALAEKRVKMKLERTGGFFRDQATGNVVIPLQLAQSPPETAPTRELKSIVARALPSLSWWLIGPHFSTLENEEQIIQDMHYASIAGVLILLLSAVAIVLARRWRLVLLIPVVLVSVGISMGLTILIFGSIHGLTLAFGPGVIGLALDYGLHGAVRMQFRRTWTANVFGMLTTVAGLAILMTSQIPLLRQLMAFSALGMGIAFLLYFLLFRFYPRYFLVEPFRLKTRAHPALTGVIGILTAFAVATPFVIRPDFDMRNLDFQEPRAREVSNWLFTRIDVKPPLFSVHPSSDALARSHEEKSWADSKGIEVENLANYLPTRDEQERNLASWSAESCARFRASLTATERKFFSPFLDSVLCRTHGIPGLDENEAPKSYLRHIGSRGKWLTLWLPPTLDAEAAIRQKYPEASSLREIAQVFPRQLESELKWMAPLSLLLALSLLLIYFRGRIGFALLAVLPFFTGLGLVSFAQLVFSWHLSFIGVIALIMVFGFSLDYGIFAADLMRNPDPHSEEAVWTATLLSAFATITGFVPLLFCRHPVLLQLGQTLFLGAIGTYLGTRWGIPGAMRLRR